MSAKKRTAMARPAGENITADYLSETAARLALLAPPVRPPAARVKEQLLARVRAAQLAQPPAPAGWHFESTTAAEGWRDAAFPGVRSKTLSVDEARDVVLVLIEMAPGARFPDHLHAAGGEEGIVISGDVITAGRLMRTGDYYLAEEGTAHTDTVSPHGCVALVSITARAWQSWRDKGATI